MKRPLIVAELSANLAAGGPSNMLATVDAAHEAGADAIKLQTWTPGTMVIDQDYRVTQGPWTGRRLGDLYHDAHTPWAWHKPVFERARELGMQAWSTPFDRQAVDFLEILDCPMYKIASFELVDLPLIRYAASTGKPLILSTGMATDKEIQQAIAAARFRNMHHPITLLRCVSAYPALPEHVCLPAMTKMAVEYGTDFGLSDHTLTDGAACGAAIMGAGMIEKHFTLSRANGGPDAHFSLEPPEFARLVQNVRAAKAAMATPASPIRTSEHPELRRGAYWRSDLPAGHVVGPEDILTARPATITSIADAERWIGQPLPAAVKWHQAIEFPPDV